MFNLFVKRVFDILISFFGIIIFTPLFAVIALMIFFDSKGPILFKQDRLGKNGKIFKIFKFRTMIVNAEKQGLGIKTNNNDPRITKIGNFLRKTSLDELPQFFNVLIGNMSLVGPRPPVTFHPYKYNEYPKGFQKRFLFKPGITGLAQINVRNSASWDERIEIDLEYVEKFSILLDIKIILYTIVKVFMRENIYKK